MRLRVNLVLVVLLSVVVLVPTPGSTAESPLGNLLLAGDLDDDGGTDLLSMRPVTDDPTTPTTDETAQRVTALDGSDRSELWSVDLPSATHYRVQQLSDGGILFVGYTYSAGSIFVNNLDGYEMSYGCCVTGTGLLRTHIFAVDSDGTPRWDRLLGDGTYVYGPHPALSEEVAIFWGTVADSDSHDMSIVSIYNRQPTPDGQDDSVTTVVVDNSTGETVSSNQTDIDGRRTLVSPIDDVSGDGTDDYLIEATPVGNISVSGTSPVIGQYEFPPQDHPPTELHAIDSATGEEIWMRAVPDEKDVAQLGDVVGDASPDLALNALSVETSDGTRTIELIDGSSGEIAREIPGQLAITTPDSDSDSNDRADLLAIDYIAEGATRSVSYSLYSTAGPRLRLESHSVVIPPEGIARLTPLLDAGDVNADGTIDLAHILAVDSPGPVDPRDERFIDGKDGSTIRAGQTGSPLFTSVDGSGDDMYFVQPVPESSARDLVVRDALTGDELWTARIQPEGEGTIFVAVQSDDMDGDGFADLLVRVSSTSADPTVDLGQVNDEVHVEYLVLSGADGHLLWQG